MRMLISDGWCSIRKLCRLTTRAGLKSVAARKLAVLAVCVCTTAMIATQPVAAQTSGSSVIERFDGLRVGPISDTNQLRWFYGKTGYSVLDFAQLAFQRDRAAIYAEAYSDYIYPFRLLGYVRTGLGLLFQSGEDTIVSANERMFNGGGNASVYFSLPLLSYANYVGDKEQGRLTVALAPRVAIDISAMGAKVENPTFNLDLSADIDVRMRTFSEVVQVFGGIRYGRRSGSPFFYDHLGHHDQGAFMLGTFKVGVIIAKFLQLGMTRTFLAPEEMRAAIRPTMMIRFSSRAET